MKKTRLITTALIIFLFGLILFWLRLTFFHPPFDEDDVMYTTGVIEKVYTETSFTAPTSTPVSTHFVEMDNGMSFQCPGMKKDFLESYIGKKVTVGYIKCNSTFVFYIVNKCVYFSSDNIVYRSISEAKKMTLEGHITLIAALLLLWLYFNIPYAIDIIERIQNYREESKRKKKRAAKKKKKAELRKKYAQPDENNK